MRARRRGSIRLWQTELFLVVIVVAILILSGSLSAGLKTTLTDMAETNERRNASALAERIESSLPQGFTDTSQIRDLVREYRDIYGSGIWVYDADGAILEAEFDVAPTAAVLESALLWGLDRETPHATSNLRAGDWVVASHPIHNQYGKLQGVVITASSADQPAAILRAVRDRLWVTFWASLATAGLLGFGFSELMSRRIRSMSDAAAAIAAGDFDQRLPTGLVPDEVQDLAESYNRMAVTLGAAFGEIQESRRRIAAVVESMAEGLLAFDSSGRVRVVNPEAARLFGIEAGAAEGMSAGDLTAEPLMQDAIRRALSGESATETVSIGDRVLLARCTPLLDAGGRVDGAVLLLADMTDRHRMEAAQRRFVADASHEMRTPIAALKGMLELLEDGAKDVPKVRDDFIHTMQTEADRLSRLVTDLLTLASLEAGSLTMQPGPVDAGEMFDEVTGVLRTLAEQAGVTLETVLPAGHTRVLADRDRIVQVLLSFTDNAIKHSPPGGTVRLSAEPGADRVALAVTDQGPGIGADELDHVFERFYRADSARGGAGTGLGLAIARELVEAHGSTIEVESPAGGGTTFRFTLPVA
jgi:PAS domain S-box-containing protein